MTGTTLRVAVATPLPIELQRLIVDREPRIELAVDEGLLPPMRFAADFAGDPGFRRSAHQQRDFERLLDSAEALYGIPDVSPAALRRAVQHNPGLRWVQTMAAGGGSQVQAAELSDDELERVAFTSSAGVHGGSLAEFAIFGLLAGAKQLRRLERDQRAHHWPAERIPLGQLDGQRILVAGLGGIGSRIVELLLGFGAEVVGMSRSGSGPAGLAEVVPLERLIETVGTVDGIVAALPGTDATTGLFSTAVWRAVREGVTVVNVGRGTVFDESALIDALRSGRVGFAALDVVVAEPLEPSSPLWDLENVLISPHTAALDPREEQRIAELFAENARRLLDGEELINRIDTVDFY